MENPRFWLGFLSIGFGWILFDGWGRMTDLEIMFPPFNYNYYRLVISIPLAIWFYVTGATEGKISLGVITKVILVFLAIEVLWILFSFFTKGYYLHTYWYSISVLDDLF